MKDPESQHAVELMKFVGQQLGNKTELIRVLHEELNLKLSPNNTYAQVFDAIIDAGLESAFCGKLLPRPLAAESFIDSYNKYVAAHGLRMLDRSELTKLARRLHDRGAERLSDRQSGTQIIQEILTHTSRSDIESALTELMWAGDISPFVRQSRRWVVGPLGVQHSISSRGAEVDELIDILEHYVGKNLIDSFIEQDQALKADFSLKKDDPLRLMKFIQKALVSKQTVDILGMLNTLIKNGIVRVDENDLEKYYEFVVTRCGVFEKEYEGTENLCKLVISEIDTHWLEEALGPGDKAASLEMRILGRCIRESPEDILLEFFGRPQLLKIGADMGLVVAGELNNSDLVRMIVLRLGFRLPPAVEGLTPMIEKITEGRKKITSDAVDESTKRGILVEALQGIEHVMKQLSHFYIAYLWKDEVGTVYRVDEVRDKVSEIIKREFGMSRSGGLVKFTLGMLTDLLQRMNDRVSSDARLYQLTNDMFKRDRLFPDDVIELVRAANTFSPQIKHADKKGKAVVPLDLQASNGFLSDIGDALTRLKSDAIYPTVIRVKKEVHDEYGRRYVIAVDDEGNEWTVKSDYWLEPEKVYYMHSETRPVAVGPYLFEKVF